MALKTIFVLTLMLYQLILGTGQEVEPEPKKSYPLCDFDIVAVQPLILDHLSEECKNIYNNDAALRTAMTIESVRFNEFMETLEVKENWKEQAAQEDIEVLELDFALRNRVYEGTDLNCTMTTESSNEFIDCKVRERQVMIDAILTE